MIEIGNTVKTPIGMGTVIQRQLDVLGDVVHVLVEFDEKPDPYFPDGNNREWFYVDEVKQTVIENPKVHVLYRENNFAFAACETLSGFIVPVIAYKLKVYRKGKHRTGYTEWHTAGFVIEFGIKEHSLVNRIKGGQETIDRIKSLLEIKE